MKHKRILVTGANGQLGHAIYELAPLYNPCVFFFTDVDTLDITDKKQLNDYIQSHSITYIMNCAAYTAVDKAEDEVDLCDLINHLSVRNIGEVATDNHVQVVHISTDYVFDGKKHIPYCEEDITNPQSVYGKSKLDGELALQKTCTNSIIIRTSWLYSEVGANFVKTMLRLGKEHETIQVVNDQIGTPTYAGDLAKAMMSVVMYETFTPGIYHFSNEGICSWYDFATKIMSLAGISCLVKAIQTSEYPTKAVRPAYSVFSKEKIKSTFHLQIPQWESSLKVCLKNLLKC